MTTATTLGGISPFFIVAELEPAIEFYRDALGFEVRLRFPTEDPFFAIVGRDQTQLLLKVVEPDIKPRPNPSRHPWARWDAFVYVEEPDALAFEFQGRSVMFCEDLKDWEDGLRGFAVADVDGYVTFFGRPI